MLRKITIDSAASAVWDGFVAYLSENPFNHERTLAILSSEQEAVDFRRALHRCIPAEVRGFYSIRKIEGDPRLFVSPPNLPHLCVTPRIH